MDGAPDGGISRMATPIMMGGGLNTLLSTKESVDSKEMIWKRKGTDGSMDSAGVKIHQPKVKGGLMICQRGLYALDLF